MVLINKAINEITVKLVYYGPGLCGKTTNLEKIYANPKLDNKGKMISMSTETDRTLFFDFMPMELGTIGGQKVRVQLYTVPGQVFYDATRKLVLRGADGVVFVADSQKTMRESNLESLENLETNLRLNRIDPGKVGLVFQYNKRDLANADPVEEMNGYLKPNDAPVVEASAINGTGVTATLRAAVARILENLKNNVDTSLADAPELEAPDMSAKSGVTSASAGTPKLAMKSAQSSEQVMELPHVTLAEPAPMKPATFESAFAAAAENDLPEVDPFAPMPEAEPADSPFAVDPAEEPTLTGSPFAVEEPGDSPFAAEPQSAARFGATVPAADRARLENMHASAQRVVEALEEALATAREHARAIAEQIERS